MTQRSVTHATFTIERTYEASPARVFAAWATKEAKSRWFHGPNDWNASEHILDFRVGGHERVSGGPPGGEVHTFECRYHDIVPDERIVSTYEMYADDVRTSVSLAALEFVPTGAAPSSHTPSTGPSSTASTLPRVARRARASCLPTSLATSTASGPDRSRGADQASADVERDDDDKKADSHRLTACDDDDDGREHQRGSEQQGKVAIHVVIV